MLQEVITKAKENKAVLIKAGAAVVGALAGVIVVGALTREENFEFDAAEEDLPMLEE